MSEENNPGQAQPGLSDKLVDLRNELIVQAANGFMFARSVSLVTIGFAALGADRLAAFTAASIQRGEKVEADAASMVDRYKSSIKTQIEAAEASRDALLQQVHDTVHENLRVITRMVIPQTKAADSSAPAADAGSTQP